MFVFAASLPLRQLHTPLHSKMTMTIIVNSKVLSCIKTAVHDDEVRMIQGVASLSGGDRIAARHTTCGGLE